MLTSAEEPVGQVFNVRWPRKVIEWPLPNERPYICTLPIVICLARLPACTRDGRVLGFETLETAKTACMFRTPYGVLSTKYATLATYFLRRREQERALLCSRPKRSSGQGDHRMNPPYRVFVSTTSPSILRRLCLSSSRLFIVPSRVIKVLPRAQITAPSSFSLLCFVCAACSYRLTELYVSTKMAPKICLCSITEYNSHAAPAST